MCVGRPRERCVHGRWQHTWDSTHDRAPVGTLEGQAGPRTTHTGRRRTRRQHPHPSRTTVLREGQRRCRSQKVYCTIHFLELSDTNDMLLRMMPSSCVCHGCCTGGAPRTLLRGQVLNLGPGRFLVVCRGHKDLRSTHSEWLAHTSPWYPFNPPATATGFPKLYCTIHFLCRQLNASGGFTACGPFRTAVVLVSILVVWRPINC